MYCTEGILHLIYISQNNFFVLHYYDMAKYNIHVHTGL